MKIHVPVVGLDRDSYMDSVSLTTYINHSENEMLPNG
jgi:hypothetical protein